MNDGCAIGTRVPLLTTTWLESVSDTWLSSKLYHLPFS